MRKIFKVFILIAITSSYYCDVRANTEELGLKKIKMILEEYSDCKLSLDSYKKKVYDVKNELLIHKYRGEECMFFAYFSKSILGIDRWYTSEDKSEVIEIKEFSYRGVKVKTILWKQKPIGYAPFTIECYHKQFNFLINSQTLLDEEKYRKYVMNRFNINKNYKDWKKHPSFYLNNNKLLYSNYHGYSVKIIKQIIDTLLNENK